MSNVLLFGVGVVVTLLVLAALALLVWGAILDGRYERDRRRLARPATFVAADEKPAPAADAA
jgi:hypothetical protein